MIASEPEVGQVYKGKVVKIVEFGAFVNFFGARDGLVHISQMADRRLKHASEILKEGSEVYVKVMGFDDRGKVRLAMKGIDQKTGKEVPTAEQQPGRTSRRAKPPQPRYLTKAVLRGGLLHSGGGVWTSARRGIGPEVRGDGRGTTWPDAVRSTLF